MIQTGLSRGPHRRRQTVKGYLTQHCLTQPHTCTNWVAVSNRLNTRSSERSDMETSAPLSSFRTDRPGPQRRELKDGCQSLHGHAPVVEVVRERRVMGLDDLMMRSWERRWRRPSFNVSAVVISTRLRSVTLRYDFHSGWNTSKIISRPNRCKVHAHIHPNVGDLMQRKHLKIRVE